MFMRKDLKRSILCLKFWTAFLCAVFLFVSCKPTDPFDRTPISGNVILDTQGQEFVFERPFKPRKQVVKVCFEYSDDLNAFSISKQPAFRDGTFLKLTGSVVDAKGRTYELSHVANSVENYLCLTPELTDEWMHISKRDVAFIKLLVHSNRKINITKIQWVSFNIWDI